MLMTFFRMSVHDGYAKIGVTFGQKPWEVPLGSPYFANIRSSYGL